MVSESGLASQLQLQTLTSTPKTPSPLPPVNDVKKKTKIIVSLSHFADMGSKIDSFVGWFWNEWETVTF